jgi:hypothetical protein
MEVYEKELITKFKEVSPIPSYRTILFYRTILPYTIFSERFSRPSDAELTCGCIRKSIINSLTDILWYRLLRSLLDIIHGYEWARRTKLCRYLEIFWPTHRTEKSLFWRPQKPPPCESLIAHLPPGREMGAVPSRPRSDGRNQRASLTGMTQTRLRDNMIISTRMGIIFLHVGLLING